MQDSVFTKIVKGEIPCHKIYEDDLTLAFLDIHPQVPGHTLVISKQQVETVWDLPDDVYQAVMATAKKVAVQLQAVLNAPRIGELIIGVDVPHAHVHVVPFEDSKELLTPADQSIEPDHAALAEMAKKLAF